MAYCVEKLASKMWAKNFSHEKAIALEFLSAKSFDVTLVVKRFLKIGTFLSTERANRVFQQNRPGGDRGQMCAR